MCSALQVSLSKGERDQCRPVPNPKGGPKLGILEPRAASKRLFVGSFSGLSGLHPALPPMAESLGALSSAKFGGEVVENK